MLVWNRCNRSDWGHTVTVCLYRGAHIDLTAWIITGHLSNLREDSGVGLLRNDFWKPGGAKNIRPWVLNVVYPAPLSLHWHMDIALLAIGDTTNIPADFMKRHGRSAVMVTTVQDLSWQKQLQFLPMFRWTISAPCVSWSTAASQEGFWSPDGLALGHALGHIRLFKPPVVAIEQVAGFATHEQFGLAERMMQWAGFHLLHSGTYDIATVTPCRRARWLGILVHHESLPHINMQLLHTYAWPRIPCTARNFEAIRCMTASESLQFEPSVAEATMYFASDFMPGTHRIWSKKQILDYRIPSLDGKIPTFMARYGQQHLLRPYQLSNRGLFGHFLRSGTSFRFWSPYEIALLHGQTAPVTILKPKQLGWETLGNCITIPHAIFALAHAHNIHDGDSINPTTMVETAIQGRLKTTNAAIQQDDLAWYVGQPAQIMTLQNRLRFFMSQMNWSHDQTNQWPSDVFFSPVDGILQIDHYHADSHETAKIPETIEDPIEDLDDCDDSSPPSTQYAVLPKLVPGEYGVLRVHPDVTVASLIDLWSQPLQPVAGWQPHQAMQKLRETEMPPKAILSPMPLTPESQALLDQIDMQAKSTIPILHRSSTDLTLYDIVEGSTWRQIVEWHPKLKTAKQDIFGDLHEATVFRSPSEVNDEIYEPVQPTIVESQLNALSGVHFEPLVPYNTDILVLHCEGDEEARNAFLRFWMTEDHITWYHQVGRQCNYQLIDDTTWRLIFRPKLPNPAMPLKVFVEALAWRLWKTGFMALQTNTGYDTIIKRLSKVLIRCNFAPSTPIATFLTILRHVYQLFGQGQPSMLASGRRCTEPATIWDLFDRLPKSGPIIIHFSPPMSGGGPNERNPTAKQDSLRIAQAGVANLLLDLGLDLPAVTTTTTAILDFAGLPRIHHLLQTDSASEAIQHLRQICTEAQIELPRKAASLHLAAAKTKKQKMQRNNKFHQNIDVQQYQLEEGFFRNEDQTPAMLHSQFSWHATGVTLMSTSTAQDLLATTTERAADELAIYVVGDFAIPPAFTVVSTNAPAFDSQGRRVLLNGRLIQLGHRHIQPMPPTEVELDHSKIQILAVTLWKTDFDEAMWQRLCQAPVKTTRDLLALEGYQDTMSKPWGRSFRAKGLPVEASKADSIQFHAEFHRGPRLQSLLKRSGFNRIFMIPKTPEGMTDGAWKVIWLAMSPSMIESKSANLTGAAGLVRGSKSVGLRIEAGAYQQAWLKLKPDQTPPDNRMMPLTYRLQPFPVGTTKKSCRNGQPPMTGQQSHSDQ